MFHSLIIYVTLRVALNVSDRIGILIVDHLFLRDSNNQGKGYQGVSDFDYNASGLSSLSFLYYNDDKYKDLA